MLVVRDVAVSGYRSLRAIRFPVGTLSVFIGANSVGKTNLYRALERLQSAAAGTLVRDLAAEGGMDSVSWAGERKRHESARIRWTVELADEATGLAYDYAVEAGFKPLKAAAGFPLEPEIKTERLRLISGRRPATMLDRDGPGGFVRDAEGGQAQPRGRSAALRNGPRHPPGCGRQSGTPWRAQRPDGLALPP